MKNILIFLMLLMLPTIVQARNTGTWGSPLTPLEVTLDTNAAITLKANDCKGALRINNDNDVIDYTLPDAEEGLYCIFYSRHAAVITIDTFDANDTISLDGTDLTAGNAIDSAGDKGDYILLSATGDSLWMSLGRSGTWVDGGTD